MKKERPTTAEWLEAAEITLVRCAIFNIRRISEVEEMKVSDLKKLRVVPMMKI